MDSFVSYRLNKVFMWSFSTLIWQWAIYKIFWDCSWLNKFIFYTFWIYMYRVAREWLKRDRFGFQSRSEERLPETESSSVPLWKPSLHGWNIVDTTLNSIQSINQPYEKFFQQKIVNFNPNKSGYTKALKNVFSECCHCFSSLHTRTMQGKQQIWSDWTCERTRCVCET